MAGGESSRTPPRAPAQAAAAGGGAAGRHRLLELPNVLEGQLRSWPRTAEGTKLKHKYVVPESRWLKAERPELRIVPQELWDAVHARLDRSRQLYLTRAETSGRLNGRPKVEGGIESKYLLSGFMVCADCGGRMLAVKRTSKRGRPTSYYICSTYRQRAGACGTKGSLKMVEAHERVIDLFLTKVLTPAALKQAVDNLVKKGSEVEVLAAQKKPLVADIARLDRELKNLTAAIAGGSRPDIVLAAIAEKESARKKTAAEIASLERQERVARDFDAGAEEKKLRAELKSWRDVLERGPEHGRAVLRQILHGPIQARWHSETDTWSIFGAATFGGIIHKLFGVTVDTAELVELEVFNEHVNAELRAGRDPLSETAEELERYNAVRKVHGLKPTRVIAGGSDLDNVEDISTSTLSRPSCPRGDSNTRHAV